MKLDKLKPNEIPRGPLFAEPELIVKVIRGGASFAPSDARASEQEIRQKFIT